MRPLEAAGASSHDPARQLFTPLSQHQTASDILTLTQEVSTLSLRVKTLEDLLSKEQASVARLHAAEVSLTDELSTERSQTSLLRTELEAAKLKNAQLERESGASQQKDEMLKDLRASVKRMENEKQTWQVMLGCQMNLDTDRFTNMMNAMSAMNGMGGSASNDSA